MDTFLQFLVVLFGVFLVYRGGLSIFRREARFSNSDSEYGEEFYYGWRAVVAGLAQIAFGIVVIFMPAWAG